ncbi:MAG: integration host factor subunit alpha [Pseudomonadota bacterium]
MQKKTLTRADICDSICSKLNLSRQDAVDVLETLLEQIAVGLETDGNVKVSSFGTFLAREKGKRIGRNPKTGQEVTIPPMKSLSFRASDLLRSMVNRS